MGLGGLRLSELEKCLGGTRGCGIPAHSFVRVGVCTDVQGFCAFVCRRELLKSSEAVRARGLRHLQFCTLPCDSVCLHPLAVCPRGLSGLAALPTFQSREVLPRATVRGRGTG